MNSEFEPLEGYVLGYWNGLPTSVRKVTGIVREWREGDPPLAWWKDDVGSRISAVEVILDGVNFGGGSTYLYDEDGSGSRKVGPLGRGGPHMPHKNVPLVDVERR